MKCPHCNTGIHEGFTESLVVKEGPFIPRASQSDIPAFAWYFYHQRCPECHESIIRLERKIRGEAEVSFMAYPRSRSRPIAQEVTDPYRQDFSEACMVLADSPKASAALSRRCLQAILKDRLGAKKKDLNDQIDEVTATGKLPSHIDKGLHAVRNIGNFAAHAIKSTSTGTIVDVEPGEAEWNLEVVEMLFDFCFVQPAIAAQRKAELNKKLKRRRQARTPVTNLNLKTNNVANALATISFTFSGRMLFGRLLTGFDKSSNRAR
jgi:hypothetical protein